MRTLWPAVQVSGSSRSAFREDAEQTIAADKRFKECALRSLVCARLQLNVKRFGGRTRLLAWAYGTSDANFLSTAKITGVELYDANRVAVTNVTQLGGRRELRKPRRRAAGDSTGAVNLTTRCYWTDRTWRPTPCATKERDTPAGLARVNLF